MTGVFVHLKEKLSHESVRVGFDYLQMCSHEVYDCLGAWVSLS